MRTLMSPMAPRPTRVNHVQEGRQGGPRRGHRHAVTGTKHPMPRLPLTSTPRRPGACLLAPAPTHGAPVLGGRSPPPPLHRTPTPSRWPRGHPTCVHPTSSMPRAPPPTPRTRHPLPTAGPCHRSLAATQHCLRVWCRGRCTLQEPLLWLREGVGHSRALYPPSRRPPPPCHLSHVAIAHGPP